MNSQQLAADMAHDSKQSLRWQRPSRVPRALLIGLGVYGILIILVLTAVAVKGD